MDQFVFWGLFVAMIAIFVGYAIWMIAAERRDSDAQGTDRT